MHVVYSNTHVPLWIVQNFVKWNPVIFEYRLQSHTVSGIVNSAFACEVFIKSLLVFNGVAVEEIHGHKLNILWNKLKNIDSETALLAETRMKEWFRSDNENMFDEMLTDSSNAFEYW